MPPSSTVDSPGARLLDQICTGMRDADNQLIEAAVRLIRAGYISRAALDRSEGRFELELTLEGFDDAGQATLAFAIVNGELTTYSTLKDDEQVAFLQMIAGVAVIAFADAVRPFAPQFEPDVRRLRALVAKTPLPGVPGLSEAIAEMLDMSSREVAHPRLDWVWKYLRTEEYWSRETLLTSIIAAYIPPAKARKSRDYGSLYHITRGEPTPKSILEIWDLICVLSKPLKPLNSEDGEGIEALLQSPEFQKDFEKLQRERRLQVALRRLSNAASEETSPPAKRKKSPPTTLSVVLEVSPDLYGTGEALRFQVRRGDTGTGATLNWKALRTMLQEAIETELPPATRAVLEWSISLTSLPTTEGRTGSIEYVTDFAIRSLAIFRNPAIDGRVRWRDGSLVEFVNEPVQPELVTGADGTLQWRLKPHPAVGPRYDFYRLTGSQRGPSLAVRSGNRLAEVDLRYCPVSVFEVLRDFPFRLEDLRATEAVGAIPYLASLAVPELRPKVARTIPVTPVMSFEMNNLDVKLRLHALDASGNEWHSMEDGWKPASAKQATTPLAELDRAAEVPVPGQPYGDPDALIVQLDPEVIAPVLRWLESIVPQKSAVVDRARGTMKFTIPKTKVGDFLQAWAERPPSARYLGNPAFRDFVSLRRPPKIEIAVSASGIDWFSVAVSMEKDYEAIKLEDVRAALEADGESQTVVLPGGKLYRRDELEDYAEKLGALVDLGLPAVNGESRIHAMQVAAAASSVNRLADSELRELASIGYEARRALDSFKGIPEATPAPATAAYLRPYQREGVNFLVWSARTFGGTLLADDMGLGKTLQMLAALSALRAEAGTEAGPTLVVCPASVAHNWVREAERFGTGFRVLLLASGAERKEDLKRFREFDLVVTNYALALRDAAALAAQQWFAVALDEAQNIRNPKSEAARLLRTLRASYRFGLTGTPIENRIEDLHSIMAFTNPGYLPTATAKAKNLGLDKAQAAIAARARLRPVLLRRRKIEVAPELPDRIEERRDCELAGAQRTAYLAELKKTRELLGSAKGESIAGPDRIHLLAALTRLRQLCLHPRLIDATQQTSAKLDALLELVPTILEAGNKVLVFSQFVRMIDIIQDAFRKAEIPFRTLVGDTPTAERRTLVESFEKEETPSVFLLSLKAGGAGLNLISASHVILFDPWWNPAVEAQAIDRTHRIGQTRTVVATRLVASDTIEERILELQERKRNLVANVFDEEAFNGTLSRSDFEFLLKG